MEQVWWGRRELSLGHIMCEKMSSRRWDAEFGVQGNEFVLQI